MKASYTRWKQRLAGEKVMTFTEPDENDCGFYRFPIKERKQNAAGQNNGQWKTIGFNPVALFVDEGTLICLSDGKLLSEDRRNDAWTSFVRHPVTEEAFRAAERGEGWADFTPPAEITMAAMVQVDESGVGQIMDAIAEDAAEGVIPAANRDVAKDDNTPIARTVLEDPPDVQHATAVDNAIAAALKKVTSEAEAAQALGSKNRIAELRLAADKAGEAIYDPIYRQYTAEQKKWAPIVKRAEAKEKELNTEILTFREKERKRIAAEQRELDEANARTTDRAIAAGEPAPVVVEVAPVAAPEPLAPTYGTRKLKEEMHLILDAVTDYDAVYAFLKEEPKVKTLLLDLATAKVKAGFKVPGTTTREGLI